MPRDVDERKTRRVLAKLRRAKADAEARGESFSDWEGEFMESVEGRLNTFGSAFNDPEKGDLSEPLSGRQRVKLKEIGKKAKGKGGLKRSSSLTTRKPLQTRKPMGRGKSAKTFTPRVRDISEDLEIEDEETPRPSGPPTLRVVGGKDGEE